MKQVLFLDFISTKKFLTFLALVLLSFLTLSFFPHQIKVVKTMMSIGFSISFIAIFTQTVLEKYDKNNFMKVVAALPIKRLTIVRVQFIVLILFNLVVTGIYYVLNIKLIHANVQVKELCTIWTLSCLMQGLIFVIFYKTLSYVLSVLVLVLTLPALALGGLHIAKEWVRANPNLYSLIAVIFSITILVIAEQLAEKFFLKKDL